MIRFVSLFLFFVGACAHQNRWKDLSFSRSEIPVTDRVQAQKVMKNKIQYLNLLYEQSKDPYYGTPKWPDECLRANVIGPVEEISTGLLSVSILYLSGDGEPGACPDTRDAARSYLIYKYCNGDKSILKLSLLTDQVYDFQRLEPCSKL